MASSRYISICRGFLGTFCSRSTELNGYWIYGLLFDAVTDTVTLDLLTQYTGDSRVLSETHRIAKLKLSEQISKVQRPGVTLDRFKMCQLRITRKDPRQAMIYEMENSLEGFVFSTELSVELTNGISFNFDDSFFVAHYSHFGAGAH